jgi:hypothetical protein
LFLSFILAVLNFKPRTLLLSSRCSNTWATPLALLYFYLIQLFLRYSFPFCSRNTTAQSTYLPVWDDRCKLTCLALLLRCALSNIFARAAGMTAAPR